jgi:hypothetical protein
MALDHPGLVLIRQPEREGKKSPVTGDCHAGIRGSPGLCPEFSQTEGPSAGTQGCVRRIGGPGPWVRVNAVACPRRRWQGDGVPRRRT